MANTRCAVTEFSPRGHFGHDMAKHALNCDNEAKKAGRLHCVTSSCYSHSRCGMPIHIGQTQKNRVPLPSAAFQHFSISAQNHRTFTTPSKPATPHDNGDPYPACVSLLSREIHKNNKTTPRCWSEQCGCREAAGLRLRSLGSTPLGCTASGTNHHHHHHHHHHPHLLKHGALILHSCSCMP